jgi:hypothetical protein
VGELGEPLEPSGRELGVVSVEAVLREVQVPEGKKNLRVYFRNFPTNMYINIACVWLGGYPGMGCDHPIFASVWLRD